MRKTAHRSLTVRGYVLILLVCVVPCLTITRGGASQDDLPPSGGILTPVLYQGTPGDAAVYYKTVVTPDTGFETKDSPRIEELFHYFGYNGLQASHLETADSATTMGDYPGGEILVTRFFAPKITDVSGPVRGRQYGWRKLARFRARPDSPAAAKGLKSMYLLFNIFNDDLTISPFKTKTGLVNHSIANQVILVRSPASKLPQPAYFLTFAKFDPTEKGKLNDSFPATFDAAAPNLPGQKPYYIPDSCQVCHGESSPKLNYLDTDHWFDRVGDGVTPGDDFKALKGKQPVVFDAGSDDANSVDFKKAFDVIRTLNMEIRDQNRDADGAGTSFQRLAADMWIENHATTERHVSLFQRSITASGPYKWSEPQDKVLLPLLNQYCYRCHSSVKYHIYDKSAVLIRKGSMRDRINQNPDGLAQYFMPQDREFKDPDRTKMLNELKTVHK